MTKVTSSTKTQPAHGAAYEAVAHIYRNSPGRSWRRLNSALHDTLSAAITAHLPFMEHDFKAIRKDFSGGYWMGDGNGSAHGERYYTLAVECGHTGACIAFEKYAGRPAALWAEDVKTPMRLRVGSEFTWNRAVVTVTSMKTDHLVACTYGGHGYREHSEEISVGDFECLADRKYRQIEAVEHAGDGVTLRFGPPIDDPHIRKVNSITKITYAELAAKRKAFGIAARNAMALIANAATLW